MAQATWFSCIFILQTEIELRCPCGTCKDPRVPEAPLGCCCCNCEFGGHCYSPNTNRYRCCPNCPCPCYDTVQKKTRCCRCDCKCGYKFSKKFLWNSGAPKCKKCKGGFSVPIIGTVDTCFPATALVKLETGISIAMSELQVGDRVQTGMKLGIMHVVLSELQTKYIM